jgi:hypothetical protein
MTSEREPEERSVWVELRNLHARLDSFDDQLSEIAEVLRELRQAKDNAGVRALDQIAALCGCAEWHYPGQIVRDVEALVKQVPKDTEPAQPATYSPGNAWNFCEHWECGKRRDAHHGSELYCRPPVEDATDLHTTEQGNEG